MLCPFCHSTDWEWNRASGKGRIYSFVVYAGKDRRTIAIVELEEGVRIPAPVEGERLSCGDRVEAVLDGDVPRFRLSG